MRKIELKKDDSLDFTAKEYVYIDDKRTLVGFYPETIYELRFLHPSLDAIKEITMLVVQELNEFELTSDEIKDLQSRMDSRCPKK